MKNCLELLKKQTILVFALIILSNVILESVSCKRYFSTQKNFHFNFKIWSFHFTLTKYLKNPDDVCIFFLRSDSISYKARYRITSFQIQTSRSTFRICYRVWELKLALKKKSDTTRVVLCFQTDLADDQALCSISA